jgi:nitrogenase molybdenum-cofactor synthesis protein NifE
MLELVRQLALTLEAPVWDKVRKPAPWAAGKLAGEALSMAGVGHD